MAINTVTSGNNYVSQVQPQPQTHSERVSEKERDADRDDKRAAVAAVNAAPKPSVNTNGQTVGALINVKA